jgi:hypothetical protein
MSPHRVAGALAALLLLSTPARADDPPARPSDAPTAGASSDGASATPSLDFNLMENEPNAVTPQVGAEFDHEVARRRTMLQLHQALGLALLGSMGATVVVGQLNINDQFRGGGASGKYQTAHTVLAGTTAVLFTGVALLGVIAPTPYKKSLGWDTATAHKALMIGATAGMLTQVALGIVAANKRGSLDERSWVTAHQVVGYATAGMVAAGVVTYVF